MKELELGNNLFSIGWTTGRLCGEDENIDWFSFVAEWSFCIDESGLVEYSKVSWKNTIIRKEQAKISNRTVKKIKALLRVHDNAIRNAPHSFIPEERESDANVEWVQFGEKKIYDFPYDLSFLSDSMMYRKDEVLELKKLIQSISRILRKEHIYMSPYKGYKISCKPWEMLCLDIRGTFKLLIINLVISVLELVINIKQILFR